MSLPVFTLGGNSITFHKGQDFPVTAPREQLQVLDRTAGGSLQVETLGAILKTRTIKFSNLSAAEYAALENWFDNIAAGAANAFTYTDEDGIDSTVRWTNNFNFTEDVAGFSGSIDLELT